MQYWYTIPNTLSSSFFIWLFNLLIWKIHTIGQSSYYQEIKACQSSFRNENIQNLTPWIKKILLNEYENLAFYSNFSWPCYLHLLKMIYLNLKGSGICRHQYLRSCLESKHFSTFSSVSRMTAIFVGYLYGLFLLL